jgi:hypothetical protein
VLRFINIFSKEGKMLHELSAENKAIWVKALMIECPLFPAIPECPLQQYRSLPIPEKFHLVDDMSEEKIDAIIAQHEKCLYQREHGPAGVKV